MGLNRASRRAKPANAMAVGAAALGFVAPVAISLPSLVPAGAVAPAGNALSTRANDPNGQGYWLVGQDGGVFAFGSARFFGSLPSQGISVRNIVGIVATPTGQGYWVIGSNGKVYDFGDAQLFGPDLTTLSLNAPIVGGASVTQAGAI